MKFYIGCGKCKPELSDYFQLCWCQLNLAMFYATSALGISWQHLYNMNVFLRSVYWFWKFFHIQIVWHHLGISLPHEDGFSKVNNYYIKSTCYGVCNDDGVNTNEIWMNGDWFYSVSYTNFGYCGKATQRLPPDSIAWWTITKSEGRDIGNGCRSMWAYIYLVLISQVQAK